MENSKAVLIQNTENASDQKVVITGEYGISREISVADFEYRKRITELSKILVNYSFKEIGQAMDLNRTLQDYYVSDTPTDKTVFNNGDFKYIITLHGLAESK